MRRATELLGKMVLNQKNGEEVGRIKDLLFDRQGRLQGFLLEKKNWFHKAPFIPLSEVSFGEDMMMVCLEEIPTSDSIQEEWIHLAEGHPHFRGMPFVSSEGKQLGILEDVYFQEELGNIIGYELSDGFFSDLMEGRRVMKSPEHLLIGKDAMIIPQNEKEGVPYRRK